MPTCNIILPQRQYFVPDCSIVTLDDTLHDVDTYHLTGLVPQKTTLQFFRGQPSAINVVNNGELPVTWVVVDNPYRFTKIDQYCLAPGRNLVIANSIHLDQNYFVFNAFDGDDRSSSGKIYPITVRLCVSLSDGNKFHIEYYHY